MAIEASQIVIYLGPTLAPAEARSILSADYRPPVKRGDIGGLLSAPPMVIGIIDGVFFQSLAVSPKEILRALDVGVTVFGASSMGALRATELAPFGMIGIGRVFQLYMSGRVDADDEVAVVCDERDGRAVSEPLVNMRLALEGAFDQGIITASERRQLVRRMKLVYFPQRTNSLLLELSCEILPYAKVGRLRTFLHEHRLDAKREDAILMLEEIKLLVQSGDHTPSAHGLDRSTGGRAPS